MPSSPKAPHDIRVLRALRKIIRCIDLHSKKLKSQLGLTGPQLICLQAAAEGEGCLSVSEISQEVHLSASTVVGILDRLEHGQLIARERSREDRRRVEVRVTERGQELLANAPSPLQDTFAAAFAQQTELEQSTIALALERVVELMEAREVDAAPILVTEPIDALSGPAESPPKT